MAGPANQATHSVLVRVGGASSAVHAIQRSVPGRALAGGDARRTERRGGVGRAVPAGGVARGVLVLARVTVLTVDSSLRSIAGHAHAGGQRLGPRIDGGAVGRALLARCLLREFTVLPCSARAADGSGRGAETGPGWAGALGKGLSVEESQLYAVALCTRPRIVVVVESGLALCTEGTEVLVTDFTQAFCDVGCPWRGRGVGLTGEAFTVSRDVLVCVGGAGQARQRDVVDGGAADWARRACGAARGWFERAGQTKGAAIRTGVVSLGTHAIGDGVARDGGIVRDAARLAGEVGDLIGRLGAGLARTCRLTNVACDAGTCCNGGRCLVERAGVARARRARLTELVVLVGTEWAGLASRTDGGLESRLACALQCRGGSDRRGGATRTARAGSATGCRLVRPLAAGRASSAVRAGGAGAGVFAEFVRTRGAARAGTSVGANISRVAPTVTDEIARSCGIRLCRACPAAGLARAVRVGRAWVTEAWGPRVLVVTRDAQAVVH
eukprot:762433-Hanusia_phi.AAC.14